MTNQTNHQSQTKYNSRGLELTNLIRKKLPDTEVEFRSFVDRMGWYIHHPQMTWSVWIGNKWDDALDYIAELDDDPRTVLSELVMFGDADITDYQVEIFWEGKL